MRAPPPRYLIERHAGEELLWVFGRDREGEWGAIGWFAPSEVAAGSGAFAAALRLHRGVAVYRVMPEERPGHGPSLRAVANFIEGRRMPDGERASGRGSEPGREG